MLPAVRPKDTDLGNLKIVNPKPTFFRSVSRSAPQIGSPRQRNDLGLTTLFAAFGPAVANRNLGFGDPAERHLAVRNKPDQLCEVFVGCVSLVIGQSGNAMGSELGVRQYNVRVVRAMHAGPERAIHDCPQGGVLSSRASTCTTEPAHRRLGGDGKEL